MTLSALIVNSTVKRLTHILCRIDSRQLHKVPHRGPLILVTNHVNFLDVPVIYTQLLPRPVTGFVKSETWDNPVMAFLFDIWGGIPIHRGEADLEAIRKAIIALEQGYILAIAPEGTRSGNGKLIRGRPGAITVALKTGSPILPVAYYGGEKFSVNFRQLKRTDFHIVVGRSFFIDIHGEKVTRHLRTRIIDEVMYQIAKLLPEDYRGYYADLDKATEQYIRYIET